MQADISLFSARAQRHGCQEVPGFDGGRALRFVNADLQNATDYVQFPGAVPDANSFTLRLWIKAEMGACHTYCRGEEFLPIADRTDPAQYTDIQRQYSSTLLANTTFNDLHAPGLAIAHLQPRAYLTVHILPLGAQEAVQFTGIRETYDGRWHMLTLAVDREGEAALYIDDQKKAAADISAWKGLTLGLTSFRLGADAAGKNGFGVGDVGLFTMEYRVLGAEEIARLYYADALRMLMHEIASRHWEESPLFDRATADAFLAKARQLAQGGTQADYQALKATYYDFMLHTVPPDLKIAVVSDLHCDGEEGGRTQAFRKGLRWANDLGMEVLIDGGDYSNFGKDFELDAYWDSIRAYWKNKPQFVSVGNHETLERKCYELVQYHCDRLREQGLVGPDHDKFFYDGEYKGYHFIVLAQYSDTYTVTGYKRMWRHAAGIKPEQVAFAREKLA